MEGGPSENGHNPPLGQAFLDCGADLFSAELALLEVFSEQVVVQLSGGLDQHLSVASNLGRDVVGEGLGAGLLIEDCILADHVRDALEVMLRTNGDANRQ